MNAEKFLTQAQRHHRRMQMKLREYEMIMDMATRITTTVRLDPCHPGNSDRVGDAAVRMADISRELDRIHEQYSAAAAEIDELISRLPEMEYCMLHSYYIECRTMEASADLMPGGPISFRHAYRLKKDGIAHVQEILDRQQMEAGASAFSI